MDVLPPHTHHHFATTTPSSLRTRIPSTTSFSSYTSTSYSHPRSVSASPISSPINAFSTFSTLSSLNHAPLTTSTKSSQDLLKDVFAFDFASLLELASRSARSVIRCNAPLPGSKPVPSLLQFITTVVKSSGVGSGVIIASIIYLERLRKKLPTTARGMHCTAHRIFLASLILATKFLHDRPIRTAHGLTTPSAFPFKT
ncbi:hypothetical protein BC829DRAFT_144186 [Chytridium lagenaria]|nr:hypothetical protein BC829DRAFT_144186 [Chytridium lagenaria]